MTKLIYTQFLYQIYLTLEKKVKQMYKKSMYLIHNKEHSFLSKSNNYFLQVMLVIVKLNNLPTKPYYR